jgi:chromate reductase
MRASIGMLGTAGRQYHLRRCLVFLNMYPLLRPEVMVPFDQEKVDGAGKVTDPETGQAIRELLEALVA